MKRKGAASPPQPYVRQKVDMSFFSTKKHFHKKQDMLMELASKKHRTKDDDDDEEGEEVMKIEDKEEKSVYGDNDDDDDNERNATEGGKRRANNISPYVPLPERIRPLRLEDVIGQDKAVSVIMPYLYGETDEYDAAADASGVCDGKRVRGKKGRGGGYANKRRGSDGATARLRSIILWGPPGCGKTTLGRIIGEAIHAQDPRRPFVFLSAASCRVGDIKSASSVPGTVLFLDEIHRFNKLQQDSLLKVVEDGTITLIGATTENPSFEVRGALLSRCRVIQIERLKPRHLQVIVRRAFGQVGFAADENAICAIANMSDGDARKAVNTVESVAAALVLEKMKEGSGEGEAEPPQPQPQQPQHRIVTIEDVKRALCSKDLLFYDKDGEEHYNTISALHKSMRGGDVGASIYWLARMLEGGEDPLYVARRVVRFAAEDVGLADPHGMELAVAAFQAAHQLGMPECNVCLSLAVAYLARAPKSIAVYQAYEKAREVIEETGTLPVPLHIRNAPTHLMEDMGYGSGYKYTPEYVARGLDPTQEYLPEAIRGTVFFTMDDLNKNRTSGDKTEKPPPVRAKTVSQVPTTVTPMPRSVMVPAKTTIPIINPQPKRQQNPIVVVPKKEKEDENEKSFMEGISEDELKVILDEFSLSDSESNNNINDNNVKVDNIDNNNINVDDIIDDICKDIDDNNININDNNIINNNNNININDNNNINGNNIKVDNININDIIDDICKDIDDNDISDDILDDINDNNNNIINSNNINNINDNIGNNNINNEINNDIIIINEDTNSNIDNNNNINSNIISLQLNENNNKDGSK